MGCGGSKEVLLESELPHNEQPPAPIPSPTPAPAPSPTSSTPAPAPAPPVNTNQPISTDTVTSNEIQVHIESPRAPSPQSEEPSVQSPSQVLSTPPPSQLIISPGSDDGRNTSQMSILESPVNPTVENLQTLRDTQNAHCGKSMDDRRLKAFVATAFDEDEDEEEETVVSRTLYIKAKSTDREAVHNKTQDCVTVINNLSSPPVMSTEIDSTSAPVKKPPSPAAGVDRKRVGSKISPVKRLMTPKPAIAGMRPSGLNDFDMDDDDTKAQQKSLQIDVPSSAMQSPTATLLTPTHNSSSRSPPPESKRGFLVQCADTERASTSPTKAYHVLDNGTLYQVDSVKKVASSPFGMMDNRAIELRNASLNVRDNAIDIITDESGQGQTSPSGRRVVSFEFKNQYEREAWVDALKQHIEYSAHSAQSTD